MRTIACHDCGLMFGDVIPHDPEDPDSVARLDQLRQLVRDNVCPVTECHVFVAHIGYGFMLDWRMRTVLKRWHEHDHVP